MDDIRNFDTPEEMLDYISKVNEEGIVAYEGLPDWVKQLLVPGQHFMMTTIYDFNVFGEIIESEYDEDKQSLAASPHLRLIRGYSVACVEGEVGIELTCNLLPISKYIFELARACAWDLSVEQLKELIGV